MDVARWLEEVYFLQDTFSPRRAIREVYETVIPLLGDHMLCLKGNSSGTIVVDKILATVDLDKTSVLLAVSFLTTASGSKLHLKEYRRYYDRVETKLRLEAPERCGRILAGLK